MSTHTLSLSRTRTHTYPALMAVLRSVDVETLVFTVIMFRFIR